MMAEPSISELDRRLNRLEKSINDSIDAGFARLDGQLARMVTADVFAMFRESVNQRVTTTEGWCRALDAKHEKDTKELRDDLEQEQADRAADRRNTNKVLVTAIVGILGVLATIAGIFIPLALA